MTTKDSKDTKSEQKDDKTVEDTGEHPFGTCVPLSYCTCKDTK